MPENCCFCGKKYSIIILTVENALKKSKYFKIVKRSLKNYNIPPFQSELHPKSPVAKREARAGNRPIARYYPIKQDERFPKFQRTKGGPAGGGRDQRFFEHLPVGPVGWVLGARSRTTSFV
jgi:hypothetical protein